MAKKQRKAQAPVAPEAAPDPQTGKIMSDEQRIRMSEIVHRCQRVLHALTAVMIGAFVLIVLFTTFSTGGFVQVTGRALYFLILAAAVLSLGTWVLRVLTERRLGAEMHVVSDVLRKV